MMKTSTATPTPMLVEKTKGVRMGQGHGDGSWEEEEHYIEVYDNCDGTFTKNTVTEISKHTVHDVNIRIHKTKENMSEKEYFKRKLAGDLYETVE